ATRRRSLDRRSRTIARSWPDRRVSFGRYRRSALAAQAHATRRASVARPGRRLVRRRSRIPLLLLLGRELAREGAHSRGQRAARNRAPLRSQRPNRLSALCERRQTLEVASCGHCRHDTCSDDKVAEALSVVTLFRVLAKQRSKRL